MSTKDPKQQNLQSEPEPAALRSLRSLIGFLTKPIRALIPSQAQMLVPSAGLVLRASAFAVVLVTGVVLAIGSFVWMWGAVRVPDSQVQQVWLQYGHSRAPYATVDLVATTGQPTVKLARGQEYDISLELTLPASRKNLELGNFMVSLELINADRKHGQVVSRPASLPASPLLRSVLSLIIPPPTHHLRVPLLSRARLSPRLVRAEVEVGRKDAHLALGGWDGGRGEVQIFDARLKFEAHLEGIRWLLRHHPILAFIVFVPTFVLFELIAAAVVWAVYASRSTAPEIEGLDEGEKIRIKAESPRLEVKLEPLESSDEGESTISTTEDDSLGKLGRLGRGIGMTGVEESETGEEDEGLSESASASGRWEGEQDEMVDVGVKDEDDAATIGGSETTRATGSSFGPSLASTSATATSRGSLRSRQSGALSAV